MFLEPKHNITLFIRTEKLSCCIGVKMKEYAYDINNVRACSGGYRSVWHTVRLERIQVPREKVQETLKEMDPEAARRELNVCEGDGTGILAFQFMGVSTDSICTFPQKKVWTDPAMVVC